MSAKKNRSRLILPAALTLVVLGTAVLVFAGLQENSVYFVNVSEALAVGTDNLNQARLFGTVDPKNLNMDEKGLGVRFGLADKENPQQVIFVEYAGVVPDTFKPGVEVIVEGKMDQGRQVFTAGTLMTKCPSKYKKQSQEG